MVENEDIIPEFDPADDLDLDEAQGSDSAKKHSGGEADRLFMEFVDKCNAGENPSIEEFLRAHPDHAEELALLFQFWQDIPRGKKEDESVSGEEEDEDDSLLPDWLPKEFGNYRPIRWLGGGGYGFVCLAEQKSLKRLVALKILRRPTPRALERFKQEASILARLDDPRIVSIHEHGKELGFWFYSMEFIPGLSLEKVVDRGKTQLEKAEAAGKKPSIYDLDLRTLLPEFSFTQKSHSIPYVQFVVELMADVCEAMEHVHMRGIIHRDLKPANLIMNRVGLPRIIDFGLAREGVNPNGQENEKLGTILYMSPEQVNPGKKPVDQRSDIFSLGVCLHELLTLNHPFEGESNREVEEKILEAAPATLRKIDGRLPRDLEAIVSHAMERNPEKRYPNCGAFAADLRRFLAGESVSVRPIGPIRKAIRWAAHRPKQVAAGIAFTAITAGCLYILTRTEEDYLEAWKEKQLEEFAKYLGENSDDSLTTQPDFWKGLSTKAKSMPPRPKRNPPKTKKDRKPSMRGNPVEAGADKAKRNGARPIGVPNPKLDPNSRSVPMGLKKPMAGGGGQSRSLSAAAGGRANRSLSGNGIHATLFPSKGNGGNAAKGGRQSGARSVRQIARTWMRLHGRRSAGLKGPGVVPQRKQPSLGPNGNLPSLGVLRQRPPQEKPSKTGGKPAEASGKKTEKKPSNQPDKDG